MTILLDIPQLFGVSIEVYFILLILGISTFYIWRWLLKRFIKNNKKRSVAIWIATIAATPLIYIGIVMFWFFGISYYPTSDFDKQKWIADKEMRYELSKDIIDSEILIGKTKAEVRQILGDDGNTDKSDHWYYYLGYRPGFANIDPDVLEIEFIDNKVVKVGQKER